MSRVVDSYKRLKKRIDSYVGRYPLPSREENTQSFVTLRVLEAEPLKGHEYKTLRDTIILRNGGFGMKYAIAYCKKINDESIIEDIFQQAQIGIIEAVDRFDPTRGVNFTTFAWHYVKKCIIDFIKCNKVVVAPRDMARNIRNVADAHDKLFTENHGDTASATDIKDRVNKDKGIDIKESMIDDIVQLINLNSASPNETFIMGMTEDISYIDKHEFYTRLSSSILKDLVKLDTDVLELVKLRFGIECDRPYSLPEIAIVKKLTPEKIEEYKEKTRVFLNSIQEKEYGIISNNNALSI